MTTDGPDRLDSWKEIAAFLGRDERTAMRWAAQQGMPVHRVPGGKRSRVFASKREISDWILSRTTERSRVEPKIRDSRLWIYVSGVLSVLAVTFLGISLYLYYSHAAPAQKVTRVTFTSDAVLAWRGSHQLWKYRFRWPLIRKPWNPPKKITDFVHILDLNHRTKRVVVLVAPLRLGFNRDDPFEDAVDCFSNSGKLLWSYVPHEKFQFGRNLLAGPWAVTTLYVSETGGKIAIWVAEDHHTWGNSFVVQLNPDNGHAKLRFVNTGVLQSLNQVKTANGSYLLAGGFNNEYSAGILAVINMNKPFAVSPQTPGTRHYCNSCGLGAPKEYFVFPRSTVNRVEGHYEDDIRQIDVYGDRIRLEKCELASDKPVSVIYLFRAMSTIHPISWRFSSGYDMLYRHLEKEGKIHHSLADAPERLHPLPVSVWTPSAGWEDYDFRSPGFAASNPVPISKPPRYLSVSAPRQ